MLSKGTGVWMLILLTVAVACAAGLAPRFAQPLAYHHFADQRSWLGIANFGDVVSNLAFAIVGVGGLVVVLGSAGMAEAMRLRSVGEVSFVDTQERWAYVIVFAGMVLVAAGSSYYHLTPDNARLVWDRLPMTIVFMALVDAMITEHVSVKAGLVLLPILLTVGIGSVLQWHASEVRGQGDLRFYAAVQVLCSAGFAGDVDAAVPLYAWWRPGDDRGVLCFGEIAGKCGCRRAFAGSCSERPHAEAPCGRCGRLVGAADARKAAASASSNGRATIAGGCCWASDWFRRRLASRFKLTEEGLSAVQRLWQEAFFLRFARIRNQGA